MAWTYDPAKLNDSPKDQIRLLIGDTNENEQLLQDEEIQFYIDQCPNDVNRAALVCVNVIITRICSTPDYTLGPYSESNGNRLKAFQFIRDELDAKITGYNAPLSNSPTTEPIFGYDMMSVHCCIKED
jgi:hypothetical protein